MIIKTPRPCSGCGAMPDSSGLWVHDTHCQYWQYGSFTPPTKPPKHGWICPKCGCGVAPWMPYCSQCRRGEPDDGQ